MSDIKWNKGRDSRSNGKKGITRSKVFKLVSINTHARTHTQNKFRLSYDLKTSFYLINLVKVIWRGRINKSLGSRICRGFNAPLNKQPDKRKRKSGVTNSDSSQTQTSQAIFYLRNIKSETDPGGVKAGRRGEEF